MLSMTYGREYYQPIQFHGFDVGPFTRTTTLREGETIKQARERLSAELSGLMVAEFETKLARYLDRIETVGERTRARAKRRGGSDE